MDYRSDIATLLTERCASCHGAVDPAAGWRAEGYANVVGCVSGDVPAATSSPQAARPPLFDVLERSDHASLLNPEEMAQLRAWIVAGAPAGRGVHEAAFVDPRAPGRHGAFLRAKRYRPLLDVTDADACRTCHDGAPGRNAASPSSAPGATACTTCHGEAEGVFACSTCHGAANRAFPPRDACFFPNDASQPHAAHVNAGPLRAQGMPCASCHPTPAGPGSFDLAHADGYVEVWLDYAALGANARYDSTTRQCAGTCHDRGGDHPRPSWSEPGPMGCGGCHGSPPPGHYPGACSTCHNGVDATGSALLDASLHLNGRVDVGNGSGSCGSCHGDGTDPLPATGAHRAHASPRASAPVACDTCHVVPSPGSMHPTGKPRAAVRFGGLALARGRRPSYDPDTQTCAGSYCHEGRGGAQIAPSWNAGTEGAACGACHAVPPPPPHSQSDTCAGGSCHQGVSGSTFTPEAAARHVDGVISRGL